jgi:tetratricopeptide (TPR) repeat protein
MKATTLAALCMALYGLACSFPRPAFAAEPLEAPTAASPNAATGETYTERLTALQQEWDAAKYRTVDKRARKEAFLILLDHSAAIAERFPEQVEAIAWNGIVLSTYAGEVGGMSAMKYAKAARNALHEAEQMESTALQGGIYASLGALYSKVPGGLVGFGDDDLAEQYFRKALTVKPDSIDANYFYGEFLLERGMAREALAALERALGAPTVEGRPIFDAGRRAEIRTLMARARKAIEH